MKSNSHLYPEVFGNDEIFPGIEDVRLSVAEMLTYGVKGSEFYVGENAEGEPPNIQLEQLINFHTIDRPHWEAMRDIMANPLRYGVEKVPKTPYEATDSDSIECCDESHYLFRIDPTELDQFAHGIVHAQGRREEKPNLDVEIGNYRTDKGRRWWVVSYNFDYGDEFNSCNIGKFANYNIGRKPFLSFIFTPTAHKIDDLDYDIFPHEVRWHLTTTAGPAKINGFEGVQYYYDSERHSKEFFRFYSPEQTEAISGAEKNIAIVCVGKIIIGGQEHYIYTAGPRFIKAYPINSQVRKNLFGDLVIRKLGLQT